ncbi:Zn-ribbon domain-containing OB-fold protein [Devosia pacifica]|nr:zinc ribbon domain-containing protein [Devosia pacifica]
MADILDYEDLNVPGPTATALSQPFWDAAAEGRLILQRCLACERAVFYPRAICPHCWSDALAWQEASGSGRLRTWSIIERSAHPAWQAVAPYAIGIVALEEGPTMLSHILGDRDGFALDAPMRVRFVMVAGRSLPFFEIST